MKNNSMIPEYGNLSALEISHGTKNKIFSAEDICREALNRAEKIQSAIHPFIHISSESALDAAGKLDDKLNGSERKDEKNSPDGELLLSGVPVAIKDNFCTMDAPTTCGSQMLSGWKPPFDATVVERIRKAGAVIVGKTNMDEFAMGSSTENSAFGPTLNPWNHDYVPGGSSGGSAAAVAAGVVPISIGSDTGGSVRQPAGFCGVTGLKPTYGCISRFGLIAFASSLDTVGIFAGNAKDTALLLKVISGPDGKDATCINRHVHDYTLPSEGNRSLTGIKIGIPTLEREITPEVKEIFEKAVEIMKELGAEIVRGSLLPHQSLFLPAYYIIATAEASSNLARYDGVRFGFRVKDASTIDEMFRKSRSRGFGMEVKRRILTGTYALSAGYYDEYYLKACKIRSLARNDFRTALRGTEILMMPVSPTPPFRLGEKTDNPLMMYESDIFTLGVNLAGYPAVSTPAGFTNDGLPVGVQLVSAPYTENLLLKVTELFEEKTGIGNISSPPVR